MNRLLFRPSIPGLFLIFLVGLIAMPGVATAKSNKPETGQTLAMNLCQACHVFKGADQAGTLGPPFVGMSQRFPDRVQLYNIIYDAQKSLKPHTMMPPFGRHGFLNKKQTDKLIDFLYTL